MKKLLLLCLFLGTISAPGFADKKISKITLDLSKLEAGVNVYEFTYGVDGRMATSKLTTDGTLQYSYNLSWQEGKLVCTGTDDFQSSMETYFLNSSGLATSYSASGGANASFSYDADGYLISGSGADGQGSDAISWSAQATYQNNSIVKAVVSDGSDTFNLSLTPSSTQDVVGLYQHLYDSMGFATGFFSGVMGKSSKMLPSKASTTIQNFPITLTWSYTYSGGLVTAYTESATLFGQVVKCNIEYVETQGVSNIAGDMPEINIAGNTITCPGYAISAYSPSGICVASAQNSVTLPAGIYIVRIGTKTLKVII